MSRSMPVLCAFFVLFLMSYHGLAGSGEMPGKAGYAGNETCKGCHPKLSSDFQLSIHAKKMIKNSPVNRDGCESCHGPGAQHVEQGGGRGNIFNFTKKREAGAKSAKCLACHEESKILAFWKMGRHAARDLSCDSCHSIHASTGKKLLKVSEPALCYDCHKPIKAAANKQSHHPLNEGKVKCSDCHDSMGGFGTKMIRADDVGEICFMCHAEKRGPFTWEHPPVTENCLTCHDVHGSNHTHLLIRKAPLLCQSCHNVSFHPTLPYTQQHTFKGEASYGKNKLIGRSCLNCHTKIHGSSFHGEEGSLFLR